MNKCIKTQQQNIKESLSYELNRFLYVLNSDHDYMDLEPELWLCNEKIQNIREVAKKLCVRNLIDHDEKELSLDFRKNQEKEHFVQHEDLSSEYKVESNSPPECAKKADLKRVYKKSLNEELGNTFKRPFDDFAFNADKYNKLRNIEGLYFFDKNEIEILSYKPIATIYSEMDRSHTMIFVRFNDRTEKLIYSELHENFDMDYFHDTQFDVFKDIYLGSAHNSRLFKLQGYAID